MRRNVLKGCLSITSALLVPGCSGVGNALADSDEPESVGSCSKITEDVEGDPPVVLLSNESENQHKVTLRLVSRYGQNNGELFCERTFTLQEHSAENNPSLNVRLSDGGTYEFTVELASGESLQFEEFIGSDQTVSISIRESSTLSWSTIAVDGNPVVNL